MVDGTARHAARRASKEGGTSLEVARGVNEEGKCVEAPADTPGQRLLECCLYVWLFLAILCLGCGAGLIANRRLGETHAANRAERRPGRFAEYFDDEEGAAGREVGVARPDSVARRWPSRGPSRLSSGAQCSGGASAVPLLRHRFRSGCRVQPTERDALWGPQ